MVVRMPLVPCGPWVALWSMYLRSIEIQNVRSIPYTKLEFDPSNYAGWHVVIGDNGSGKSTFVRSVALALAGPVEAAALRQNWVEWLRAGENAGGISLAIDSDPMFDKRTGTGRNVTNFYLVAKLRLLRADGDERRAGIVALSAANVRLDPKAYLWGTGAGWFSASYGPFRRFTGGNKDYEKLFYSNPKLAPHLSAFGEDIALTEALDWLRMLRVRELEGKVPSSILKALKRFINESGLLPHGTVLQDVTSESIRFEDAYGNVLPVEQLSDGYRSILSLTFELIRQLARAYGDEAVFGDLDRDFCVNLPGVVLVDEIDAHLHPTWQRTIGTWFRRHFPRIQFIVTTHSPLVCHAAETGSIWQLPSPMDPGPARKITGVARDRLVFGNVLEALDTDLFGTDVSRSDSSLRQLQRLANLNQQALLAPLSEDESKELLRLRRTFPTAAGVGA